MAKNKNSAYFKANFYFWPKEIFVCSCPFSLYNDKLSKNLCFFDIFLQNKGKLQSGGFTAHLCRINKKAYYINFIVLQ